MDPSYNAILKLFWFNTSEHKDGSNIEDKKSTKSRAVKIFKSFKRTFKQGSSRYRDKLSHFDTCLVDMHSNRSQESPSGDNEEALNNADTLSPAPSLGKEHFNLAKYGWYWGPLTKREAEARLTNQVDGAFLVRDSSSNNYIYTLSLRSYSYIMHTHIQYYNGTYSLGSCLSRPSVSELIETAIEMSKDSILSYVEYSNTSVPIRLLKPISRNLEVRTLTHLCRFVIRQHCNVNAIEELPLPTTLKTYLLQGQY